MPQPPNRPVMARGLSRVIPFVTPRTFLADGSAGWPLLPALGAVTAEFDCLEGFADFNLFNTVLPYPGAANTPKLHAVGPFLDAAVWADGAGGHVPGPVATLEVWYAIDQGCVYRPPVAPITVNGNVLTNISGLRITGRFVRVRLTNALGADIVLEFGVYVRSA
jgi:hypothetical protein